jgi:hypothetical protein
MKKAQLLIAVASATLLLLLGEKAPAQSQDAPDFQNMSPQEFQNRVEAFQKMDPQQKQAAMQQFQSLDPEQRQAAMQQFQNIDPQLQQSVTQTMQQDAMQQFQNMDPQQMMDMFQQRLNSSLREQMGITNDTEWSLIEVKIAAVTKARMALMADSNGMMNLGGMRGGGRGFQAMFGQPSPESKALQQAMDSEVSKAQTRDLLAKYRAAHRDKQATLARAQEELRALLTVRQEAIVTLAGLLD